MSISISKAVRLIVFEIEYKVKMITLLKASFTAITIKWVFVKSEIFRTFM